MSHESQGISRWQQATERLEVDGQCVVLWHSKPQYDWMVMSIEPAGTDGPESVERVVLAKNHPDDISKIVHTSVPVDIFLEWQLTDRTLKSLEQ